MSCNNPNSPLNKLFSDKRRDPIRVLQEARPAIGELERISLTRSASDQRYTKSTVFTSSVNGLQTQIGTNVGNIATNTSSIGTNTGNIATNTTSIGNNSSGISTNTSNIATNTSDIGTNTTNITNNTTNITNIESDITDLEDEPFVTYSSTGNLSSERVLTEGTNITIDTSVSGQIIINAAASGAPTDAHYLVLSLDGDLDNERRFVAGNGLDDSDGGANGNYTLEVGEGNGITVNANDVALTTPGTLTASTSNSASGSHTHAITASDNPGASASLLKTDSNGLLTLEELYISDSSGDSEFSSGTKFQVINADMGVARDSGDGNALYVAHAYDGFAGFRGRRAGGSIGSPSNVGNDTEVARFGGGGYGSGFPSTSPAYMSIWTSQSQSGSNKGHRIEFWTTDNGSSSATQKGMIDNDGKMAVGGSHTPSYVLDVDGTIRTTTQVRVEQGIYVGGEGDASQGLVVFEERSGGSPSAKSGALSVWWDGTNLKAREPGGTIRTIDWT